MKDREHERAARARPVRHQRGAGPVASGISRHQHVQNPLPRGQGADRAGPVTIGLSPVLGGGHRAAALHPHRAAGFLPSVAGDQGAARRRRRPRQRGLRGFGYPGRRRRVQARADRHVPAPAARGGGHRRRGADRAGGLRPDPPGRPAVWARGPRGRPGGGRAPPVRGAGPAPAGGQGRGRPGGQPRRAGSGAAAAPARPWRQGRGGPDRLADRGSHLAAARDAGRIRAG